MAIYRQVQTSFWQDDFVLNLTPEEKYFYLFLLTNSKTKQCGIYQLPVQVIVFETGYNQETVEKLLHRFIDYGKIIYSIKTKEIGIVNWQKYNPAESPKVKACVNKELKEIKDRSLIDKIYPMDRVSQKEQEQAEKKEKKEAEEKEEEGNPGSAAPATVSFNLISKEENQSRTSSNFITNYANNDYDYNCHGIQDQASMLFLRIWNKPHKNPEELRLVTGYLTSYGFQEVELAFKEAVKYDRKKLAYVEAICKKRKERAALEKEKEFARKKREELNQLIAEERKSGKSLNLIKAVFGNNVDNRTID
jgi:hypothetical protein